MRHEMMSGKMNDKMTDCSQLERGVIDPDFSRDILESDIPSDVLDVLLLDRTTGKSLEVATTLFI